MVKVEILPSLEEEINQVFRANAVEVFEFLKTLEQSPKKGKPLGSVGGIIIKELKYRNYRFYFITDAFKIRFLKIEELTDLLLQFVRMSDKRTQQKTINEIRNLLIVLGPQGFS